MKTRGDDVSALFRQATEFLGATHPVRLGSAIMLGFTSHGIAKILARSVSNDAITAAADLASLYYMAFWATIFFVPLAFGWRGAPEGAVIYVRTLRLLIEQADFSSEERRHMWRTLVYKYLDAAKPDLSGRPTAKTLFDQAASEIKPQVNESGT